MSYRFLKFHIAVSNKDIQSTAYIHYLSFEVFKRPLLLELYFRLRLISVHGHVILHRSVIFSRTIKLCTCIAKFGYCHNVLSICLSVVVVFTGVYFDIASHCLNQKSSSVPHDFALILHVKFDD